MLAIGNKALYNNHILAKEKILLAIKISISGVLVYYLLRILNITEIIQLLKKANLSFIFISLLLVIPNILLQFYKWKLFCKKLLNENSNRQILSSLLTGIAGGLVLPFNIGQYAGRSSSLQKNYFGSVIATAIDNFSHLLIILFAGIISIPVFLWKYCDVQTHIAFLLVVSSSIISYLVYKLLTKKELRGWLYSRLKKFNTCRNYLDNSEILNKLDKKIFYKAVILSAFLFLCYIFQFALLMSAFSFTSDLFTFQLIGTLVIFSKTIIPPIALGDLGIRESASVFFATQAGLSAAVGFNAAIFLYLINIVVPSILSLFFLRAVK